MQEYTQRIMPTANDNTDNNGSLTMRDQPNRLLKNRVAQRAQRTSFDLNRFNSTVRYKSTFYDIQFTSTLQGFVSEKQSVNTMRNSLVPISFPKGERFKVHRNAGSVAPFYSIKDVFKANDAHHKKGWGFGHAQRKVFDQSKIAYIPAPDNYYNKETFSEFVEDK